MQSSPAASLFMGNQKDGAGEYLRVINNHDGCFNTCCKAALSNVALSANRIQEVRIDLNCIRAWGAGGGYL
jgi:hypothetical protein